MPCVVKKKTKAKIMLAERKSKEKWSQDPRNTFWSRDKSKFGWRMLERMGWSEDDGLGREGHGRTDHIRVQKKRDNSGVGTKRGRDEDWIQHQDTFDQLLAGLNRGHGEEVATSGRGEETATGSKSIVENAKESKRIMYKRFLKSKDLSAASSEEMDCVLGRKRRKPTEPETKQEAPTKVDTQAENEVTSHGITTITKSQSVSDYFSEKMSKLKSKRTKHKTN